jgi:hypothetical protein
MTDFRKLNENVRKYICKIYVKDNESRYVSWNYISPAEDEDEKITNLEQIASKMFLRGGIEYFEKWIESFPAILDVADYYVGDAVGILHSLYNLTERERNESTLTHSEACHIITKLIFDFITGPNY